MVHWEGIIPVRAKIVKLNMAVKKERKRVITRIVWLIADIAR